MAKIKLLPIFLLCFFTSGLRSAALSPEILNKQTNRDRHPEPLLSENQEEADEISDELAQKLWIDKLRMDQLKKSALSDEPLADKEQAFFKKDQLEQATDQPQEEEKDTDSREKFLAFIGYVLKAYPSSVTGLYHAIRHDVDHGFKHNLTVWEICALNDLLKLKKKFFDGLIDLANPAHDDFLVEYSKMEEVDRVKRDLFALVAKDLGRQMVVFTPTAWDISRAVIQIAFPAAILKALDEGIRYSVSAAPIAAAGVGISLVDKFHRIERGEDAVFKSFPINRYLFPLEAINYPVKKIHRDVSHLERWFIGAISLIIRDLNHIGVLANYGHMGVGLAQIAVISASLIPLATVPGTIASLSLSAIDQGINLKAKHASLAAASHKKVVLNLVGRLLSNNVMVDYLKDLGIFERKLRAEALRKTLSKFSQERLWIFYQLMALVFRGYLFP